MENVVITTYRKPWKWYPEKNKTYLGKWIICKEITNNKDIFGKGVVDMKATVDRDGCIECGLCASICPEVFRMGDDGPAEAYVDEVPESAEQTAVEAQEGCPVSVITVE